jgi:hypothetical protein
VQLAARSRVAPRSCTFFINMVEGTGTCPLMVALLYCGATAVLAARPAADTMEVVLATRCGPRVPVLSLEHVPKPESASLLPTQVLVQVAASSVNPVDWKILGCGAHFPTRTGWDLAGTVAAVGSGCKRLS